MLKFSFLNLAKPKKVFEKLNKMDRKQAYTVGAIIVVAVIALLMLVSSMDSEEDVMAGMSAHGYDLATMPFVNDEAEKLLLASAYPDMRENGSTLLYTPLEKEERQKEDEQNELEALENDLKAAETGNSYEQSSQSVGSSGGNGSGRGRGYTGKGGAGRTPTEIGKLEKGTMAGSGGSGIGSFYGPSVDNRGLHGQSGSVAPAQLKTAEAKKALQQFRAGSFQASRLRDNKNINARKAMQGGNIQGSQAFSDKGIDVSKLGGLALDTSELPTTHDLGNLDDQVENAVKEQAKPEKPEEKLGFWEQLGQDLLRQAASGLVDAITTGVGDSIKGWVNGNSASRAARKQEGARMASQVNGKSWLDMTPEEKGWFDNDDMKYEAFKNLTPKQQMNVLAGTNQARVEGKVAQAEARAAAIGTTKSPTTNDTQIGQKKTDECKKNCKKNNTGADLTNCLLMC